MSSVRRAVLLVLALVAVFAVRPGPVAAVVGGSTVPQGKYPFMAALTSDGSQICGGSVIASTWVLTAAHCVPDGSAAGLAVRVGHVDWTRGTNIGVAQVIVHPGYDEDTSANDAALLRLSRTVPTGVTAIRLAGAGDDGLEATGTPVVVAGWGSEVPLIGLVPPPGTRMREANLRVVDDATCTEDLDPATQVCAEAFLADSCQGDSGGPLFANPGGGRVQIGIVSYGFGCGVPEFPGVYSEVNSASIRSFVAANAGV